MFEAGRLYGRCRSRKKLIKSDGELSLIHYYLQKGFDWDRLCNLSEGEKTFLAASMQVESETEAEKYRALLGGDK